MRMQTKLDGADDAKAPDRLKAPGLLCGEWWALMARWMLAGGVAAFAFPVAYVVFRLVKQTVAPEISMDMDGRAQQPDRLTRLFMAHSIFWMQVMGWPALIWFSCWLCAASYNARLVANGLLWSRLPGVIVFAHPLINGVALFFVLAAFSELDGVAAIFAGFFVSVGSAIVIFFHLRELWRSSDPQAVRGSSSNLWISLWAAFCLGAPLLFAAGVYADTTGSSFRELLFLLCPLSLAAAGVVMIRIIRDIARRQWARYQALYEDAE
jgi:hypothetical protein